MVIVPLPHINLADYATVREILSGDLPGRYHDWLYVQAKAETDSVMEGNAVQRIQIDPDELARYCDAHDDRSPDVLAHFLHGKARGERY